MLTPSIADRLVTGLYYFKKNPTAAICVLLTTEVAVYAVNYLRQLYKQKIESSTESGTQLGRSTVATTSSSKEPNLTSLNSTIKKNLSGSIAGIILYAACAMNIIPYLSLIGVLGYAIYVIYRKVQQEKGDEEYFSVKNLHTIFQSLYNILEIFVKNCHPAWYLVAILAVAFGIWRGLLALTFHLHPFNT